jgi:hypothetical protein
MLTNLKVIKLFYLFSCSSEWHFNQCRFNPFCIFFGLNGISIYRWSVTLTTEAKVSFWPKCFCDRIQVGLRDSKEALTYIQTGYYVVGVRMNPFKKTFNFSNYHAKWLCLKKFSRNWVFLMFRRSNCPCVA